MANNSDNSIYQLIYDNVGILTLDIDTLYPEGLLTNTILDFYLRYLFHQLLSKEQRKKLSICTASYFHENIIEQSDNDNSKIQILDKDFLLMPAYYNAHWFLIILCYPRNIDSNVPINPLEFPRIVILDSSSNFLMRHRPHILQKFQSFVQNQIAAESGKSKNDDVDDELPVNFVPVAQQTNDYDCGLFLLEFAEQFILDNFETSPNRPNYAKDDGINCDKKRENIRQLIEKLSNQAIQHYPD